ncbi:MAG: response regulator [Anaerolineales bacterium]|nr:response regulator [Anaerolineales bacterium]
MVEPLILVSDDSQEIRDYLEEALATLADFRVVSVGDGMSALSLVNELEPDLVITDQQMPNLTGMELVRRLKLERPLLPVILMTGESTESLIVEGLRAGVVDYLVKPFDPDTLLDSIHRALSSASKWRELIAIGPQGIRDRKATDEPSVSSERLATDTEKSAMLELDEVLSGAVDTAVRLTGAEEGSLLLLDDRSGELYMRASKNFDDEFARTFRVYADDSLAGQVISSGQPVFLDETTPQKIKTSYLVHSLLYVPLQLREKIIGVLGVDNRTPGQKLTTQDRDILMAIADYAALAIENAQLFLRSETERLQLETIIAQIENGVIVIDGDNRLLLINSTAHQALGIEENPIGLGVRQIFNDPRLIALIETNGEMTRREELELLDGRIFSAQRTPIEGVGQAIVMQDITHLKELDRIKSEFVTTVSHDLRSPLTSILGYIELIERAGEVNKQQQDFIQRVHSSVQQISLMISDLLDLGRIEAGLATTKEVISIEKIARGSYDSVAGAAGAAGIELDLQIEGDIGSVFGDPIRIRQMLTNLLDNAIKYTPNQGKVSFHAKAEDDQVILNVTDTGPGIPKSDMPYLFDRFFRGSNVPEHLPGTGLGLAIVKSILDNHNGRIWVESTEGEGSSFTVVLPSVKKEQVNM